MTSAVDQAAPGELELVRQFVNTRDVEHDTDELATRADAEAWLAAHGLPRRGALDERARARLRSVREALRAMLLASNAGEPAPAAAIAELNGEAAETAIGLRFDPAASALVTRSGGTDAVIGRLLVIIHEAIGTGIWRRLKVCPADDCLWAFYDHSRNRSGTWCRMEECGNRAKARAFRERRRATARGRASR